MDVLVACNKISGDTNRVRSIETATCKLHWVGLAYMDGIAAGANSIATFGALISDPGRDLPLISRDLKGAYLAVVQHKASRDFYCFVDPTGLNHAYRSDHFVANSFLEIASAESIRSADLDPMAIVEFFHFGSVFLNKTLSTKVAVIAPQEIVRIDANGRVSEIVRPLGDIDEHASTTLLSALEMLTVSIANEKISVDLTGGIDSRLLAVVLSYFGLKFELAVSGRPDCSDVVIARSVAAALEKDLNVTEHSASLLEEDMPRLFNLCDGIFDCCAFHRPMHLAQDRLKRGVTLALSGTGGELYKDFWWMQDFPFYKRRHANLQRLFRLRIAGITPRHEYLKGIYYGLSQSYEARTLAALRAIAAPAETNTQAYDLIYYHFKMRSLVGQFVTNMERIMDFYPPYLERDTVRFGYSLPRSKRFFNYHHRELLTHCNPHVARIRTGEGGMTASAELAHLAADMSRYVVNKVARLGRKFGQKTFRKMWKESADDPRLSDCARTLVRKRRTLEHLKDAQILSPNIQIEDLEQKYLGNVLMLDMLLERLERTAVSSPAKVASDY
jgi:hypothetical protein